VETTITRIKNSKTKGTCHLDLLILLLDSVTLEYYGKINEILKINLLEVPLVQPQKGENGFRSALHGPSKSIATFLAQP
jgi:hypothetical protein